MSGIEQVPPGAVTLADVAARAGVSPSTVSRVLNRPGMLPPATENRIRAIADALGYHPNRAARSLSTGQSDLVLIVVPDVANPFFPRLVRAVQGELLESGLYGVLIDTVDSPGAEVRLIRKVAPNTHGIIDMSSRLEPKELLDLASEQPIVLVNREVEGIAGVLLDTELGIRDGIGRLLELGHTRFAYVRGPAVSWSDRIRERTVRETLTSGGEQPAHLVTIEPGDSTFDGGVRAAGPIATSGTTAVQVFDDTMAEGVIQGLAALGLRVPEDVSVIGCDGTLAPSIRGSLATVACDFEAAGRLAAQMLVRCRRGLDIPEPHVQVPGRFLPGATIGTAAVPRKVDDVCS